MRSEHGGATVGQPYPLGIHYSLTRYMSPQSRSLCFPVPSSPFDAGTGVAVSETVVVEYWGDDPS